MLKWIYTFERERRSDKYINEDFVLLLLSSNGLLIEILGPGTEVSAVI